VRWVRVAVVTGAGSGLGRAAAQVLLNDGWQVVLGGRRRAALEETAAGRKSAVVAPLDVTDVAAVDAFFADVRERLGRIDLLFNNAGMFGPSAPFEAVTPEQWLEVVATNLDVRSRGPVLPRWR